MSEFRKATIKHIYEKLEQGDFTIHDFQIKFPKDTETLVEITFVPVPDYQFKVAPDALEHTYRIDVKPGLYFTQETYEQSDLEKCVDTILHWCRNISSELRASTPLYDDFAEFRKKLEQ